MASTACEGPVDSAERAGELGEGRGGRGVQTGEGGSLGRPAAGWGAPPTPDPEQVGRERAEKASDHPGWGGLPPLNLLQPPTSSYFPGA